MKLLRLIGSVMMAATLACASGLSAAEEAASLAMGQTLYLPVYSFLWHGNVKGGYPSKTPLSVLVSIRNTDPNRPIRLLSARYYDTSGKLIQEYLAAPKTIAPMGTYELYVERGDVSGGSGANFLLAWQSEAPVNPPLVEAVHAELRGHSTLSFVTSARPIHPGAAK